ncbi:MAG: RNA polymerase sigma factor [uncultured bacterium]|nr:MAG: RNA polymerase sigma factor [uncultured bacterium]
MKLILQISKKLISHYGITNVAEIIEQVFQKTGQALTDKYVISILAVFKNFSWLDESKGWFWLASTKRNRILSIIRKILSVCESINLHELRAGIGKSYRMEGLVPTTRVLLELCKQIPWCKVESNMITANPPIMVEDVLGNHELRMYQILKEQGPLMATVEFEAACLNFGIARNSFYQYLSYSPILNRYISGVYGLRGADIPPGLAESIAPTKRKVFSKTDYGWTNGGDIWVIRQLSISTIHDGRFSIPTALSQYLPESIMLKSVDGTILQNLQIDKNYHSVNIRSFLKRSGYEAGDYLALTFYLSKKEAIAYMGGEEIWDDFIAKN